MKITKTIVSIVGIMTIFLLLFIMRERTLDTEETKPDETLKITVSFYPLAFLANEIGGNKVRVTNVTPAGAEPHEYEPTPRDIIDMEKSSLLIVNGLGLESWRDSMKKNLDPKKTFVLAVGEGLENPETKDPHVWISPVRMKTMAEKIEQSFSKADPKNEDYYIANLQVLKTKLDSLDGEYTRVLAKCEQTSIVTSHSAFKYLASDYGLREISIAGLSPDAEPSPKELAEIVNFSKAYGVKYIFFESLASPKLSQMIADEVGAKTLVLNPLEGLTKKEQAEGKNYLSVMKENLANLKIALSCTN